MPPLSDGVHALFGRRCSARNVQITRKLTQKACKHSSDSKRLIRNSVWLRSPAYCKLLDSTIASLNTVHHSKRSALATALIVATTSATLSVKCFGFAEVARGALTLETEGRVTYDSYFLGAKKIGDDDYYASLRPQLRYVRKAGLAEIEAFGGVSIVRYDTYKEFDSEDINAGFRSQLPVSEGSRISGDVSLNYNESTTVDYTVLDRVPTRNASAQASLRYALGLKMALSDSINYSRTLRTQYSDQEVFGNDVSFSYADFLYGSTFSLSHGYTRTTSSGDNVLGADLDQHSNSVSGTLSHPLAGQLTGAFTYGYRILDRSQAESVTGQKRQEGSFFSATLNGPFLPPRYFPKLDSSMSLSYQESRSPGINDLGGKTLTGSIGLRWAARERTKLNFQANRSIDLAANDYSVENTNVSLGITESVGIAHQFSGNVGYTWQKFRGVDRKDNIFNASLTYNYSLSRYWSLGASYTYQKNDTNTNGPTLQPGFRTPYQNYERHTVSVYVTNTF